MSSITPPIALYNNLPIHPEYYAARRYVIAAIAMGMTTLVTTTVDHDYLVLQQVRLLLPKAYSAQQLNGVSAYVLAVPNPDEVELSLNSSGSDPFIAEPFIAVITGVSKAPHGVLTAVNHFVPGQRIEIAGVEGMTELNGRLLTVLSATSTTITTNINTVSFNTYTGGGTAELAFYDTSQPQIVPIGDISSGIITNTDNMSTGTAIPGSFINIS